VYSVVGLEFPTEQGDDVIQLVIEIRRLSARLLKDRTRRREPLRQNQLGRSERRRK
jgi:hypothetical protein